MALTVAQLVARLTADTSGFYRSMAVANSALIRTGSIASRVAAGVGLATLGMGVVSVRAAANFQTAMNLVQATSGATTKQMKQLSDQAVALGKDFKLPNVSAKDAAEAMVELGKAGFSTNQILKATRGVLQLGLAANMSFSDSAIIVARSLKAFNLEGEESARVANLLAAGANKSTADITDLAYGMQNASGQFSSARMPIEALVIALAELADKGLSGEYAGTALKTMLIRLQSPTKQAAAIMEKFGINVYDAQGKMKPMPAIIKAFADAFKGSSDQVKQQALNTIFGTRANQAMIKLMEGGVGTWNKYKDAIVGTDAAQRMTEARTKGMNGAMGALGSAVETLAIQLGTAMLPSLEKLTRKMAEFIANIDANRIIGFFSAIKDGIQWFFKLVTATTVGRAALIGIAAALGGLLIINMVVGLVTALASAFMFLGGALLANPIGLTIAAIVALAAALIYAYQNSERFREIVNAVFSWLRDNVPPIAQAVVDNVSAAWSGLVDIFNSIFPPLRDKFMEIFNQIATLVSTYSDTIKAVITAVWDFVKTYIVAQLTALIAAFKLFFAILRGDWSEAWNQLKALVVAIVKGTFDTVVSILKGALNILKALAGDIVQAIILQFKQKLNQVVSTFTTVFNTVWGFLRGAVSTAVGLALAIGNAIVRGILQGVVDVVSAVWGKFQDLWSWLKSLPGYVFGLAVAIGEKIVSGILSGIGDLAGKIGGKISGALGSALGHINIPGFSPPEAAAAKAVGKPIADGIIRGFLLGITDLPSTISNSLRTALEAGRAVIQQYQAQYQQDFSNLTNDIMAAFDAATAAWKGPAQKALDALVAKEAADAAKKRIKDLKDDLKQAQAELKTAMQKQADEIAAIEKKLAEDLAAIDTQEQTGAITPEEAAQKRAEAQKAANDAILQATKDNGAAINAAVAQVEDAKQALQDEKDAQALAKKKAQLEKEIEEENKQHNAKRALKRRHLEEELADLEEMLAKHPEKWKFYHDKIIKLMKSFGISYRSAGKALGDAFAEGLKESMANIAAVLKQILSLIEDNMKTKSPTKKGPMSDLDTWWEGFGPTLVSGLDTDLIGSVIQKAVPTASSATLPMTTVPAGGSVVVYVNVDKAIGSDLDQAGQELAAPVTREILSTLKRNGLVR